jgi:hypothetical protein
MARISFAQLLGRNALTSVNADPEDVLAPLITGLNPDSTPYRLPVSDVPAGLYTVETPAGLSTLAALATVASPGRDLLGVASGGTFTETTMAGRFRAFCNADRAFTLNVEASDDNATFDPVGAPLAVAAGSYGGFLEVPVLARYMRARVTNTDAANAFTFARLRTVAIDL